MPRTTGSRSRPCIISLNWTSAVNSGMNPHDTARATLHRLQSLSPMRVSPSPCCGPSRQRHRTTPDVELDAAVPSHAAEQPTLRAARRVHERNGVLDDQPFIHVPVAGVDDDGV